MTEREIGYKLGIEAAAKLMEDLRFVQARAGAADPGPKVQKSKEVMPDDRVRIVAQTHTQCEETGEHRAVELTSASRPRRVQAAHWVARFIYDRAKTQIHTPEEMAELILQAEEEMPDCLGAGAADPGDSPLPKICPTCGTDIRCVHGKLFTETCEPCEAPGEAEE